MSDKQNLEQPAVTAPQPIHAEYPANLSQPIIIERKSGRGLATGALTLSVLALGASGFLFVEGQNALKQQENTVKQELEKAALGESQNARSLQMSLDHQERLNTELVTLRKEQLEDHQHIANLQRSYNELLKGRVNWLVDEIEVTLNVASQQLLLSGNVPVAISTLSSIEQRLKRFDQPELIAIKQAISSDLNNLKAQSSNYLDVSSTSLKVDSLEKGVASLPLIVDSALQPVSNEAAPSATSADFWTRTWDKTVSMLKGMVEIRKLESSDAMLLSPEQIYFVRANLRLRLLDARLALLQHNNEVYKNNLAAAESTVKQYFDVNSPTTQEWLKNLQELNNQNVQIVSDSALSASQQAISRYQSTTESTKEPISLRDVPARSDIMLPPLSNNQTASAPSTQAAPAVVNVQTASVPALSSTTLEAATPASPVAMPVPETLPAIASEASVSGNTTTAAAAAALAAAPVAAKAISNQLNHSSTTNETADKPSTTHSAASTSSAAKASNSPSAAKASNSPSAAKPSTVKKDEPKVTEKKATSKPAEKPKVRTALENRLRQSQRTEERKANRVGKTQTGKPAQSKRAESVTSTEPVKPKLSQRTPKRDLSAKSARQRQTVPKKPAIKYDQLIEKTRKEQANLANPARVSRMPSKLPENLSSSTQNIDLIKFN